MELSVALTQCAVPAAASRSAGFPGFRMIQRVGFASSLGHREHHLRASAGILSKLPLQVPVVFPDEQRLLLGAMPSA